MKREDGTQGSRALVQRRRILTALGLVLVALGLAFGVRVAWFLVWTNSQANQQQAALVAAQPWVVTIPAAVDHGETGLTPESMEAPQDAPSAPEPEAIGATFATLHVPAWGLDYVKPISQGTDNATVLDVLGIGHYVGSAMPGAE